LAIRSEINVTPLVDVCLVLLIIFMVVTPILVDGVEVDLPETAAPERMPEAGGQLDVVIEQDGSIYVGQQWVREESLPAALLGIHDRSPGQAVVIKADRRLAYRDVRRVMQLLNHAGWSGAGIETHKREVRSDDEAVAR